MYGYRKLIGLVVALAAEIILVFVGINIPEEIQSQFVNIILTLLGVGGVGIPAAYGLFVKGNIDAKKVMTKQDEIPIVKEAQPLNVVVIPFDTEAWENKITDYAQKMYSNITESTKFFASIDLLGTLPPDPNNYETQIKYEISANHALMSYQEIFGFDYYESEGHLKDNPACRYYSVANMARQTGKWPMLIKVERALWNAGAPVNNWSGWASPY